MYVCRHTKRVQYVTTVILHHCRGEKTSAVCVRPLFYDIFKTYCCNITVWIPIRVENSIFRTAENGVTRVSRRTTCPNDNVRTRD